MESEGSEKGSGKNGSTLPHKPYTTPHDYKAPSMSEQWKYAMTKHPYAKYGYAMAILVGVVGYGIATARDKDHTERS